MWFDIRTLHNVLITHQINIKLEKNESVESLYYKNENENDKNKN